MKMTKNQKGFTLAELLIVMAIIVVLAAIAVPTFAKQLETSRESSDVENIRAAAANAFSECYTKYVTDDQVQAEDYYYSSVYKVKFNQHEANFQYMTPVIEVGTSNTPGSDVSGAVTIKGTPGGMVAGGTGDNALPGDGYLQFQFRVSDEGDFYLTDIYGQAAAPSGNDLRLEAYGPTVTTSGTTTSRTQASAVVSPSLKPTGT